MEIVYFTLAAVVLYLVADRAVDAVERRVGRRLEYRTLLFFAVLLALAVVTFALLRRVAPG